MSAEYSEWERIAVREELKRMSGVMAEMLPLYLRLKRKKRLNKIEKGQMERIHAFFGSLQENLVNATKVLRDDIMAKALVCYQMIKKADKPNEPEIQDCYKEFRESYDESMMIWSQENWN